MLRAFFLPLPVPFFRREVPVIHGPGTYAVAIQFVEIATGRKIAVIPVGLVNVS